MRLLKKIAIVCVTLIISFYMTIFITSPFINNTNIEVLPLPIFLISLTGIEALLLFITKKIITKKIVENKYFAILLIVFGFILISYLITGLYFLGNIWG